MSIKSSIAKGAIISYISIFLNLIISFAYTPWMIHKIGVSDYGLYSLAASFIGYFVLDFGMSSSIARFIAKYRAEGRTDKVENLLGLTAKIYLAIDVVIFFVLLVLYFFVSEIFVGLTPEELEKFKILYIISGTFAILSFAFKPMGGAMMAYEYFVENKLLDMVTRVGTVLIVMACLLMNGNVISLVFVTGAVGFAVNVSKYMIFVKKSHLKINYRFFEKTELLVLFSFSVWIFLMGVAQRFRLTLVQSILGIFSNSTQISIFALAMTMEGMVYTLSSALNGLFLPKVTLLNYEKDRKSISDLMVRVGRIQLFIITLIFSGFCIFGREFIVLWVGPEFKNVYVILICLIVSNMVSLTQQIADDLVYAENQVKYTAIITISASAVGLVISVLLAPKLGAIGCGIGTGFALISTVIAKNIFYDKKMQIDVKLFFRKCHVKILPSLVLVGLAFAFLKQFWTMNTWLTLSIGIIAYTLVYCVVVYFLLLNKEEKALCAQLLHIK